MEEQRNGQHQGGRAHAAKAAESEVRQRRLIALESDGGHAPVHINAQAQTVADRRGQQPGGGDAHDVSAEPIQRRT